MTSNPFETLLTKLLNERVRFVLVDGVAGLAHGLARATYDIDVCYWRHPDNIERLCASLSDTNPRLRLQPAPPNFRLDLETVLALGDLPLDTDMGAIDLLGRIAGLGDYEALLGTSEELDIFGRGVRVLTLEGLIMAKRAAGRPQDLQDVAALEAVRALRHRRGQ